MPFETPQDAEDAFYDAMEGGDAAAMEGLWDTSDSIGCLLPMAPMVQGRAVLDLLRSLLEQNGPVDIQVNHLEWIQSDDMALHLIEERLPGAQGQPGPPPLYAVNGFRKGADGWRMVLHQNSPTPPPPGSSPPGVRPVGH